MIVAIGFIVVIVSTLGGFMMAGGNPILLAHASEFVVILGVAIGMLIIAAPANIMKNMASDLSHCFKGGGLKKEEILEMFKILYELFVLGRRNGLIALDEHVSSPQTSSIFQKYPEFLKEKERLEFLVSALRPAIDGKVKPDQLKNLLEVELNAKEDEAGQSVMLLGLVADSLPGIGIVAAVLGIINTMAAISEGPEKVGEKVAAALTGTFLGVLLAYGFVNPLGKRIAFNHQGHFMYFRSMMEAIGGFAAGLSPVMAIEIARRGLDRSVQPPGEELESILKAAVSGGKPSA
jgi:chemotaxis protein MotA